MNSYRIIQLRAELASMGTPDGATWMTHKIDSFDNLQAQLLSMEADRLESVALTLLASRMSGTLTRYTPAHIKTAISIAKDFCASIDAEVSPPSDDVQEVSA